MDFVSNKFGIYSEELEFEVSKGTGSGCKTDAEISAGIAGMPVLIKTINSYYDESSPEDPIKKYIDYK